MSTRKNRQKADVPTRASNHHTAVRGLALAACSVLPAALFAQGTTATLGGTVTDKSGAVIPNASVELKNEHTGDLRKTSSNGSGVFSFPALPVGDYDVSVQAQGFTTFKQNTIHLDPGDQKTVRDLSLAPGAEATVEVVDAATQIATDSGEQSSLISAEDIKHLSVEGRDVTELFKILPGFGIARGNNSVDNTSYDPSQVTITGALGSYAANGTPLNGVSLLSDGADITDPGNFGAAIQNINYEQVAEVKTQTSSFTADTPRGPIVVNAVGKAGGDHYHGSVYTYARTTQLNSTDWFAGATGQGKPPDRQVYPGFTFGGPVPAIGGFNRNKRLTFFVGAEQYAQRNIYAYGSAANATLTALVPTAAMRAGDFSATQLAQYLGPAYTPATTASAGGVSTLGPACTGATANICYTPQTAPNGSPLVNGNIANFLNPGSQAIINSLPLPNVASNGTYNYITTNLTNNNLWQAKGRIDYAISDRNRLFVLYSTERGKNGVPQSEYYSPRGSLGGVNVPGGGLLSTINSEIGSLNLTTIATPTLTNELQISGSWLLQNFVPKNFASTQGYPYGGLFSNGSSVIPTLQDYGYDGLPVSLLPDSSYGGIFAKKWVRSAGDNLTKVLGQHTVRVGGFFQMDTNNEVVPFVATNGGISLYYFPETITDPVLGVQHMTGAVGSGSGGNYLANFLEGNVQNYLQTNVQPKPNLYFFNIDGYAQDHWRIRRNLTIDYGVRFEHLTPWGDAHGQGIPVFSAANYASDAPAGSAPASVNTALPGFRWHGVDASVPVTGIKTRWAFVEPRAGLSWDVYGGGNTIVRAGSGIYRAHDSYNDASAGLATVQGERTAQAQYINLASVSTLQGTTTSGSGFVSDSTVTGFNANDDRQPQVVTWNLAVDQKLGKNNFFEIAYVGNKSTDILNNGANQNVNLDDVNALPIGSLYKAQPNSRPDTAASAGTAVGLYAPTLGCNNCTVGTLDQAHIDSFKAFPLYNHVEIAQHNLWANYHGLQTSFVKQTGNSHYTFNYTWSKALGVLGGNANGLPSDPFNYRNDYGYETFDHRHIFNAAYSYTVGKLVTERLLAGVVNGWEVSGITTFQSGANLPSTYNPNFSLGGNLTTAQGQVGANNQTLLGTPDVSLQPILLCNPNSKTGTHQYFNGACFGLNPTVGVNGVYRLPHIAGPSYFDTDLTLKKGFHIHEGDTIQFSAAAFNFLNHPLTSFTSSVPSELTLNTQTTTAGDIGQTLSSARSQNADFGTANFKEGRRILELALRFDF